MGDSVSGLTLVATIAIVKWWAVRVFSAASAAVFTQKSISVVTSFVFSPCDFVDRSARPEKQGRSTKSYEPTRTKMPKTKATKVITGISRVDAVIHKIRSQQVILAADLAKIYGVETRTLNQAVKRNANKFPGDFLFQLTQSETSELLSRSQNVILKRGKNMKYLPYAFTEHGVVMAANVLNSKQAVTMSVYVVRAFVKLESLLFLMRTSPKSSKNLKAN